MGREDQDAARARLTKALQDVARGDREALRQVYTMTSSKLFGICLRISQDRESAEDILQDVYVKVWNRAGRFDPGRASPITWLAIIARNTAIDAVRAGGARAALPESAALEVADDRPLAPELISEAQQHERVLECLDQLEARQGRAIRTAFFEGLTYAELAERMAVPLGTMKSWVRRGLLQLRGCVGDA